MLKSGPGDGGLVSAGLLRARASPPAKMKSRNHPPSGEHHTMQLFRTTPVRSFLLDS